MIDVINASPKKYNPIKIDVINASPKKDELNFN